ncbi:MAG: AAA family ATPase, partial [Halobacteriaceae archaeon]
MTGGRRVIVVCGLPGVGKTTVSETIADRIDAPRLRTDVVRKDIIDEPAYTPAETRRMYLELVERARELVERDGQVILDGTFKNRDQRERVREMARDLDATVDI